MFPQFLNDAFKWLLDSITSGIGRLLVALLSLGFARVEKDEDKLDFPFYGVAKDAAGKIVIASGVSQFIGALALGAGIIAAIIFVSDIPL
jgi:hypothetical protein